MTNETITKTAEEIAAQTLLDQLGEFQAQADLLEIKRRELLDTVKVPEEVQAIHVDIEKRKQAIDDELAGYNRLLHEEEMQQLAAVVVPPELQAQLDAILNERIQIALVHDNKRIIAQSEAARRKIAIDDEFGLQVSKVYAQLAVRKSEINGEFEDKASAVKANIERLTIEAKAAAVKVGHTVRGHVYMAVYVPGQVRWNTDKLEGMMALIPQIKEARKEGQPNITLRHV